MIERTTLFRMTLGLMLLAACAGCSSSDDDTEDGEVTILPLSENAPNAGLTFDTAELSLREFSVQPCAPDAAALSVSDFPIDLFLDPPAGVEFVTGVSSYCGIQAKIGPATSADLPELQGSSVLLHGTRADGATFALTSGLVTTLSLESTEPFDVRHLVLGVDLDAWFANVDVTDAAASDDGVLIDADDDPDLLAAFEGDTASAFALYDDTNGDGQLTDAELVPVASATMQ